MCIHSFLPASVNAIMRLSSPVETKAGQAAPRSQQERGSVGRSAGTGLTDLYASGRGYYDAIDLAVGPDVLFSEPPQKWQGRFPHPQQKKIPPVWTRHERIAAER